ncbi:MAG: phage holin family protein [Chitinophagales bacterium]|nr:phage holin family protein [Chitinophagales bacterium]
MKIAFLRLWEQFLSLLGSFWGWVLLILCELVMIPGVKVGLIGLGVVFVLDYITGLSAYWIEWRKDKVKNDIETPYFFQSKKMRKSLVKAITYFLFVAMAWLMWFMFFDGTMRFPMSTREFNVINIAFGICIAIECWSILENMKRMGYDLIGAIGKAFKNFWKTYHVIKDDTF